MSKTLMPPTAEKLAKFGVRFVPINCFAPNHYQVKHLMFPFDGFDTYSEGIAMREASLVNAISMYLSYSGKIEELNSTIATILRIVGSTSEMAKLK